MDCITKQNVRSIVCARSKILLLQICKGWLPLSLTFLKFCFNCDSALWGYRDELVGGGSGG